MSDTEQKRTEKLPRLAIAVVALGVVASLAIYGLSFIPGSGSVSIEWDSIEPLKSPPVADVGSGSFGLARTSISTLAPNTDGTLLYRVAGVVRIDSGGKKATTVRCDVNSRSDLHTQIARSTRLRAAWPKPSDNLQAQDVPETSLVRYSTGGSNKVDLPIRDVMRRYTDSGAETLVKWDGYVEDNQNWVWTMEKGTGVGAATLPWAVIFETEDRPIGKVKCQADIGGKKKTVTIPVHQQEWPIADDEPNTPDASTGDQPNVQ